MTFTADLQAVDAGADVTANAGDVGDGAVDVGERCLRGTAGGAGQRVSRNIDSVCAGAVSDRGRSDGANSHADLAGGRSVRQKDRSGAGGENRGAVESGGASDAVDFCLDLSEFGVQSAALCLADRAGRSFRSQRHCAVKKRGDLCEGAVGNL